MILTLDAKTLRGNFKPSTAAEKEFYRQLKKVAIVSGHIIDQHANGAFLKNEKEMQRELDRYAKKIEPWASRQALKMLQKVQNSNKRAYTQKSKAIGKALKTGIADNDIGELTLALLNEQVGLITSIPTEAGLRAQKIAYEAFFTGSRANVTAESIAELAKEMGASTDVAISRAYLIARTETARANAVINQQRAMNVGSLQYRWHNSGDGAVRESHRIYKGQRLQGMIFSWDNPPTLDDGMKGHPGTFPNCRCFAEPIFLEE